MITIEAGIEANQAKDRSTDAMMQIQGAVILVRILDDTTLFKKLIENLPAQLLD